LKVRNYRVIDTHTGGEPTRIIPNFSKVKGKTMAAVLEEMQSRHDWFRRFVMNEPHGHSDMFGAVLFPPKSKECDLGVIFMDNGGYLTMCGHGTIGVVTCAVETKLVQRKSTIKLETPAGVVVTHPHYAKRHVASVSFENVPAFVLETVSISISGKTLQVHVVFGGNFFALAEAKEAGLDINRYKKSEIIETGLLIRDTVNGSVQVVHPNLPNINRVELVEFSGPALNPHANARNVVVFGQGQIDRSPCGTGTCAKLALLHSQGKLKLGESFVHEGILGTTFKGRIISQTRVGNYDAVIPEITGSAHITGFNTLRYDEADPLARGFSI
jgi:proline racemase